MVLIWSNQNMVIEI